MRGGGALCPLDDCERPVHAKGLCEPHYRQQHTPRPPTEADWTALAARFWRKVNKGAECWEWEGSRGNGGYGTFGVFRKARLAHRVAWELSRSAIPDGMEIDHMCHNRACVNPDHLHVVTRKENNENATGAQSNSTSGVRGVSPHGRGWQARVKHNGIAIHVGNYPTVAEAEAAVIARRLELFTNNLLDRARR